MPYLTVNNNCYLIKSLFSFLLCTNLNKFGVFLFFCLPQTDKLFPHFPLFVGASLSCNCSKSELLIYAYPSTLGWRYSVKMNVIDESDKKR